MTIGIPYAFHAKRRNGTLDPKAVICPTCGKRIKLTALKDWESFSRQAYAEHWNKAHAEQDPYVPPVLRSPQ